MEHHKQKELFECAMQEYFPQLSLKEGKLYDYKNTYVAMGWFFYQQGIMDQSKEKKTIISTSPEPYSEFYVGGGWEAELPPNEWFNKG